MLGKNLQTHVITTAADYPFEDAESHERFFLHVSKDCRRLVEADYLQQIIEDGFEKVARIFGPIQRRIPIGVVWSIPDDETGRVVKGRCVREDGRAIVLIALRPHWKGFSFQGLENTIVHELVHVRVYDLKLKPTVWLEEGIASFVEHPDGWSEQFFHVLKESAATTAENDSLLRARGWAVVYYLVKFYGLSVLQVLANKRFPDPRIARSWILNHPAC